MKEPSKENNMKVRAYTDGACSDNPGVGAWAVVFNDDEKCKTFSGFNPFTTNNRMELCAVIECLKIALKSKKIKHIDVFSDSAYVVNTINERWYINWMANGWKTAKGDSVKNKDLWFELINTLNELKKLNQTVTIIKVKGHNGDTFNEMADALAKQTIIEGNIAMTK